MNSLWLLGLPVAAMSGYISAALKRTRAKVSGGRADKFFKSRHYLNNLNVLFKEEPDKAVDLIVKMLDVDTDTIETHLALGNLYRRRGEVDRAIRIHQHLIGQPQLDHELRTQALYALAKDYLSAGVLDRAESLFLELIDHGTHTKESYRALLYIYQQEKEWQKAITHAQKLAATSEYNMQIEIAQYHCELAEVSIRQQERDQAIRLAKRAIAVNDKCARANLILADIEVSLGEYDKALKTLLRIKEQNADWLYLAVLKLQDVYLALRQPEAFIEYLQRVLKEYPNMPIVVLLSDQIRQLHGDHAALHFVTQWVRKQPSLAGLHDLLGLQLLTKPTESQEDLHVLHELTERLIKSQNSYQCVNCGFSGANLHWQCPSCKQWETTKPAYLIHEN